MRNTLATAALALGIGSAADTAEAGKFSRADYAAAQVVANNNGTIAPAETMDMYIQEGVLTCTGKTDENRETMGEGFGRNEEGVFVPLTIIVNADGSTKTRLSKDPRAIMAAEEANKELEKEKIRKAQEDALKKAQAVINTARNQMAPLSAGIGGLGEAARTAPLPTPKAMKMVTEKTEPLPPAPKTAVETNFAPSTGEVVNVLGFRYIGDGYPVAPKAYDEKCFVPVTGN